MRRLLLTLLLTVLGGSQGARAEFSLFGSADRTPANPFASNYASPPVRGTPERARRIRRAPPPSGSLRPPRDVPH
ncbi:hypothetical protein [Methylobacterium sp. V23]|jgi:hypothetical protein|uniref:hypothetical protein n=1 Tax=Methylobacterium sp. V23 TaxID=2044878 RepID=UPI000CDA1655|nr:hypothetical protein [Methylobacterium sp. V23]POR44818.1 hypothetical protein CRT23_02425 [Methylobacterium sp. V23]